MKIKTIKISLIILTILLIFAEAVYIFALPAIIDSALKKNTVEKLLEKETGLVLKKDSIKIRTTLFFNADIKAKNIEITDKNQHNVFSAKNIETRVFLPSLIFKTPEIKSFAAQNMILNLKRNINGDIYLGTYKIKKTNDQSLKIKKLKSKIENSQINYNDEKLKQKITVRIQNFEIKKYEKDKYIDLLVDTQINKSGRVSECDFSLESPLPLIKNADALKIKGILTDFDLGSYIHYLPQNTDNSLKKLSGIVNADFESKKENNGKNNIAADISIENFAVTMKNPSDSFSSNKKLRINILGTANKSDIFIEKFTAGTQDWGIIINGKILNYKNKTPKLDLNLEIPKSQLHPLYHMIPSLPDSNEAIQKLKKYGIWADIEGKLEIKGDPTSPDLLGKMALTDLYILKYDERIPKCRIDLDFIGQEFDIFTKVYARPNQFVRVEGRAQNRLGGYGDFHISSSPMVDLETTLTILLPVHDVVGFDLGPLPNMTLKGNGNIDIKTTGTVEDGSVVGYFNFWDTTATLEGLNVELEKASGRLDFKGKNLYFNTKAAQIKGYPIKITGNADLEGNIDFKADSASVDISELVSIVKTSPALKDRGEVLNSVEKISGNASLNLTIKGLVKDFKQMMEKVDIAGKITLKDNTAKSSFSPILAKKINGIIEFKNEEWKLNLTSEVFASKFNISAKSAQNKLFAAVNADSLKVDNLLSANLLPHFQSAQKDTTFPHTNALLSIKGEYQGPADKIATDKIILYGILKPINNNQNQPFVIRSGRVDLNNGNLVISNFNSKIFNTTAKINGKILNVFSKKPVYNYQVRVDNFDVAGFNMLKKMQFLPTYMKKILNTYENYSGRADIDITCKNNIQDGRIKLQEIKFTQKDYSIPIIIYSGDIHIDGNKISLKSLNAAFDNTPVFINASVKDLDSDVKFDGYFTTKLTESFANKYINNYMTYPLKPKGDITFTSEFQGSQKGYSIKPKIKLSEDADIYYMGANLGDTSDSREIKADVEVSGSLINVKKLSYARYMTSQNDYTYPLEIINASGKIYREKNGYSLNTFRINTPNNANIKLFNVLFKKSVLKQGMFRCDLLVNGDINAPKILGTASMTNVDMPLYDTIIKDIDIKFNNKFIKLKLNGKSFDSDFTVDADIKNQSVLPVTIEKIKISSKNVNFDSIVDSLTKVVLKSTTLNPAAGKLLDPKDPPDISDFVVKNGEVSADNMLIRGLIAQNYKAKFVLGSDSILKVSGLSFEITGGQIAGIAGYNFKTGKLFAELSAKDVDANQMSSAFFEVKDQIFGALDGNAVVYTWGSNEEERLRNASGTIFFVIRDGKMPKLGSIEYLLKAGNFIKSGITGLNINNLLDIIAPVKTGYFDTIKGFMSLKNGTAQNLEIYSSGENLSLFIRGKFDFPEQKADLNVFGRLTKKANNVLGVVGNTSFNSLLNLIPGFKLDKSDKAKIIKDINKIPGVEFNDQLYRIFTAKIDGDINGEKYVSSFKWIE